MVGVLAHCASGASPNSPASTGPSASVPAARFCDWVRARAFRSTCRAAAHKQLAPGGRSSTIRLCRYAGLPPHCTARLRRDCRGWPPPRRPGLGLGARQASCVPGGSGHLSVCQWVADPRAHRVSRTCPDDQRRPDRMPTGHKWQRGGEPPPEWAPRRRSVRSWSPNSSAWSLPDNGRTPTVLARSRATTGRARALAARDTLRVNVLWDGRELLELGGTAGGRLGGAPSDSGAAYNPATAPLAPAGERARRAPARRTPPGHGQDTRCSSSAAGLPNETATNLAGLYDPATNRWTVTAKAPVGPFSTRPPRCGQAPA